MMRSKVLLPQPLGPTRLTTSPWTTWKATSAMTVFSAKRFSVIDRSMRGCVMGQAPMVL